MQSKQETGKTTAKIKNQLSTHKDGNIFFKGTWIILPVSLEHQAFETAHAGHQGIAKMKMLLREKTWFAKIDEKVAEFVQNCIACQIIEKRTATCTITNENIGGTQLV